MSKFVSRRAEVGLAKESSRGTAASPVFWLPWSTFGGSDKIEHVVEESAMGRIENSDASYAANRWAELSFEADLFAAYIGLILTNLMGAAPSSSGSNPYTHTFSLAQNNQHTSLSILAQDKTNPDINKMYTLGMINKWQLKVEPGKIVKNTIDAMAKAGKDWTSQTSNFTALGTKFLHQHVSFKVASNLAGLDAATKISLKSLELNIEKAVMKDDVIGTVDAADFNNQDFKVTGSLMLNLEDATWLNYMLAQTTRAIEIKLNAGTNGILTIRMPLVNFHSFDPDRPLNEIAKQKIEFVGHYDAANAQAVITTCELVNAIASY